MMVAAPLLTLRTSAAAAEANRAQQCTTIAMAMLCTRDLFEARHERRGVEARGEWR
jgi:hypothetical protein